MQRNPPDIRRLLRSEVNFGCPVPDCGSPYLKYHHFDPPWREREHNNPDGMIALCATHSDFADGDAYTKEQLREFKRNPYLNSPQVSPGKLAWQRNELILFAGGFYVNPQVFLRLQGRYVVWCNRNENNYLLLNLDIRDESGHSIILMEDNDWLKVGAVDSIDDIEVPPYSHSLTVRAKKLGIFFSIEFRSYNEEALRKLGERSKMKLDQRPGPEEPVGPFGSISPQDLERILGRLEPGFERDSILLNIQLNEMIKKTPTRWEFLTQAIQAWPVTVCTMKLKLNHPFPLHIHPGKENVGGWRAGHTISVESEVVWDIQ